MVRQEKAITKAWWFFLAFCFLYLSKSAAPLTLEYILHLVAVTPTYVAETDGRIVAHTNRVDTVHLAGMTSWIEDVVVDEPYRKDGIATALLQRVMKELPPKAKHLNLTSKVTRGDAHGLTRTAQLEWSLNGPAIHRMRGAK